MAVATGAPNKENALTFINWFIKPEHAAMQSNFACYGNGVAGSAEFMDAELQNAPEIVPPEDANIIFAQTCSAEYIDLASRI